MGDFSGLYTGNSSPPDGGSPDTANAFFAEGKLGQIAPRKGKTLLQTGLFPDMLYGVQRLILPSGSRRWAVSSNDGANNEQAAPLTRAGSGSLGASAQLITFNRTSLSVAYPAGDAEATITLHQSIPAFTSKDIFFPESYIITGTASGGTEILTNGDIQFKLYDASNNDVDNVGDPSNVLDRVTNAKTALTMERDPSGFKKVTLSTTGTVTKLYLRAAVAGGVGVTGYSFTFGPFDRFWIR